MDRRRFLLASGATVLAACAADGGPTGGVPADARGHIVTAVRTELEDLGITEQELSQAGLRITTTIDPGEQRAAVETFLALARA